MRVISGTAKGRQLLSVPGNQTRPITDRVKEALFNIIGADVRDSAWWDVFAGTGAVGIEALSRGASFVRLTDVGREPVETVRANLTRTGLAAKAEVRRVDALALLRRGPDRSFDYVYLAPPQYKGLWQTALTAIEQVPDWVSEDGWVIVQIDPKEYAPLETVRLLEFDQRRYGTTSLIFYNRAA